MREARTRHPCRSGTVRDSRGHATAYGCQAKSRSAASAPHKAPTTSAQMPQPSGAPAASTPCVTVTCRDAATPGARTSWLAAARRVRHERVRDAQEARHMSRERRAARRRKRRPDTRRRRARIARRRCTSPVTSRACRSPTMVRSDQDGIGASPRPAHQPDRDHRHGHHAVVGGRENARRDAGRDPADGVRRPAKNRRPGDTGEEEVIEPVSRGAAVAHRGTRQAATCAAS